MKEKIGGALRSRRDKELGPSYVLQEPNFEGHTSPFPCAECEVVKHGLPYEAAEFARGEVWAGVDSNH